jgi:hypothetical protein
MIIERDWNRTEHDDIQLNIMPKLDEDKEAMPIYSGEIIIGWKIQSLYE